MAGLSSVVITNYNYGRWVGEAIDSALAQADCDVEVVVVDDGSTDNSREVIASYGERVRPVLQANGGQAAALNAGFAASTGDPVVFLDADDVLLPRAVARAAALLEDTSVALVHWPHQIIDEDSRATGQRLPAGALPTGDLRALVSGEGPGTHVISPMSGNALPRRLLEQLLPMPEQLRICADVYVTHLAPLFGRLLALDGPQSLYRYHPGSGYSAGSFDRRLALGYETIELVLEPCALWCRRLGLPGDPSRWRRNSWFHRLRDAVLRLEALIAPGMPFLLIDDGQTAMTPTPERRVIAFPERGGIWWGAPADDAEAIAELERQRRAGAAYLAVIWIAQWWLEHYSGFAAHLRERYPIVLADELLTVFELGPQAALGEYRA